LIAAALEAWIHTSPAQEQEKIKWSRVVGERGKGKVEFQNPFGVACDGNALYVADTSNHRVQKLRLADGAHLATTGKFDCTPGNGEGQVHAPSPFPDLSTPWRPSHRLPGPQRLRASQFNSPTGMCVGGSDLVPLLYVCDENNHRVVVLGDRVDRLVWHYDFGGFGHGEGQVRAACRVGTHGTTDRHAADRHRRVYVRPGVRPPP
jgi:hypothetical protein